MTIGSVVNLSVYGSIVVLPEYRAGILRRTPVAPSQAERLEFAEAIGWQQSSDGLPAGDFSPKTWLTEFSEKAGETERRLIPRHAPVIEKLSMTMGVWKQRLNRIPKRGS
ncbi:MAG: hypothetical protein U0936_25530 [Planctomycetaceae bacterium]